MPLWILITIVAHLLYAVVSIIDKHLVSNTALNPIVYTFYSGIFQILFLLLIPVFGFNMPEITLFILGVLNGCLFILALLIFYKALKLSEASRVIPIIGAAIPIFTVFMSYFILGEFLSITQFIAFAFFIIGGFILSLKVNNGIFSLIKGFLFAILAGFLFALYYTIVKYLYLHLSFFDGFILLQIGGFLGASLLLITRKNRQKIFFISKIVNKKTAYLFIPNKIIATIATILLFYAISIEESKISIINSLQSVQYVFLVIFAFILSKKLPHLYNEQIEKKVIMRKLLAISLIGIGLVLLVI